MVEISTQAIYMHILAHHDGHLVAWYDCVNGAADHRTLKGQQVQIAVMKSDTLLFEIIIMEDNIDLNIRLTNLHSKSVHSEQRLALTQ